LTKHNRFVIIVVISNFESQNLNHLMDRIDLIVGLQQVRKALLAGMLKQVIVAIDTDSDYFHELQNLCRQSKVELLKVSSSKSLGLAVGIDVKAGCVGVPL
jgi:large subunit ribosomal protein L7A